MGGCNSFDSRCGFPTAKLILQDGQLQEFSGPAKVSQLLQKHPDCFICNSDDMDYDDVVSPVKADEILQPGQLYFVLPLDRLRRPFAAAEIAALAVKANRALAGGKRLTVWESDLNEMKTGREIGGGVGWKTKNVARSRSQSGGGRRRRSSAAVLSVIAE